jgi:hypothetical protein
MSDTRDDREETLVLPDPATLAGDDARVAILRRRALPYRRDNEKWLEREVAAARLLAAGAEADPRHIAALAEEYRAERMTTHGGEWGDTLLRRAAALPDTPPDLLLWLGQRFPRELTRNPVLPLLTLERPAFYRELGGEGVRRVLRSPELPASVAGALAGGAADGVRSAVVTWHDGPGMEPHFAEDWSLREDARRHVSLAGEVAADDA